MAWVWLLVAGLLEVVWAYFMKLSHGFSRPIPAATSIVTMIASFALLSYAMKSLPLGVAYVTWTGIGALGTFVVGIMLLNEQASPLRLLAAGLILAGLVLMRLTSAD